LLIYQYFLRQFQLKNPVIISMKSYPILLIFTIAIMPTFAGNLPIIMLDTKGNIIVDEPKVNVTMGIIDNGPGQNNDTADAFTHYHGNIRIEIRGNSTQDYDKKSYGFETSDLFGNDSDVSLLGLPPEEDWIFYGPMIDKSLIRNVFTFHLISNMGHYASRTRFCELYINRDYKGLYVLMEKIKRDSLRLDIGKLKSTDTTGDELTGGYILKRDWIDGEGFFSEYAGIAAGPNEKLWFEYVYPKPDSLHALQKNYIKSYLDSFEMALMSVNFKNTSGVRYNNYIELNTFLDYVIINELSKNVDAYKLSTFIHKEKDSRGGKLRMGPIWDFNLAWNVATQCGGVDITLWTYKFDDGDCDRDMQPFWWNRLFEDTLFTNSLKTRWVNLRSNLLSNANLTETIDSIAAAAEEGRIRNYQRWDVWFEDFWGYPEPFPQDYNEEISNMKNWVQSRADWLDSNMPGSFREVAVESSTLEKNLELKVFPNPFNPVSRIYFPAQINNAELKIFNLHGRELFHLEIKNQKSIQWNAGRWGSSIFLVQLKQGSKIWTKKITLLK